MLVLYSTLGCHLCDLAKDLIREQGCEVREVDIAEDASLVERYGVRIPVLHSSRTGDDLDWPFDSFDLRQWLRSQDD